MATKQNFLALGAMLLFFFSSSCKKNGLADNESELKQDTIPLSELNITDVAFPQLLKAGDHKIIAGSYNNKAETDGNGSQARFLSPGGIFVKPDGSLLIADSEGNVRKIVHDTVVTTIHIPTDPDGFTYSGGADIAASKDGTIMVVGEHEYWLYTPDGVSHYHGVDSHDEVGLGVDKDPSGNFFWYTSFTQLLAVKPNGESINTKPLYSDNIGGFTGLSTSNNGVKYFTTDRAVYKYTKSGLSAQIFSEFTFNNISGITTSRDGYKIYIADQGNIKLINNNTSPKTIKTILSGQNVAGIALSNSEKYIYYSTGNNTINKLAL